MKTKIAILSTKLLDPNFYHILQLTSRRVDTAQFFVPAVIFGKVMRKTRLQKFHHTIYHTNLKAANLRFVLEKFSRVNSAINSSYSWYCPLAP